MRITHDSGRERRLGSVQPPVLYPLPRRHQLSKAFWVDSGTFEAIAVHVLRALAYRSDRKEEGPRTSFAILADATDRITECDGIERGTRLEVGQRMKDGYR